jgi:tripartite-type tricarboxylate transporter receptor subunit TctC
MRIVASRRTLLVACALALPAVALAQSYPSKPIRVVIPFGPGSATDTIARMVTEKAAKSLGTTFVVDNKPGANGLIAAREVVGAPKDGYTIIVSSNSAHAANKYLYKNIGYDPVEYFAPVIALTITPHVLVVRSTLPVKDMKEFIKYGKDHPGKLNFGAGNTGALANAALVRTMGGFTAQDVAYKSPPAAVIDLLADRLDFMSVDYFIVNEHIKSGKLRPIGVTSKSRLRALPDVPTVSETLPGYELSGWVAVFAPAGTPAPVIDRLNRALAEVIRSPEFEGYMERQGMQSFVTTPAELGDFQRKQVALWADVLKRAGVQPE